MQQIPTIVKAKTPVAAFHYTLADAGPDREVTIHEVGECTLTEPPCGPAMGRLWPTSQTHPPTKEPKLNAWAALIKELLHW